MFALPNYGISTAAPYNSPPVPFSAPLPSANCAISINAEPHHDADRFEINILNGGDVVFHFNPRFDSQSVVRNSCIDDDWGDEETDGQFPFYPGANFEITLRLRSDGILVEVNGQYHSLFRHRTDLGRWLMYELKGDITIHSISSWESQNEVMWAPSYGGSLPDCGEPVQGGHSSDGEPLYIGRAYHEGQLLVGKIHCSHGCMYGPFGGEEHRFDSCEALVAVGGAKRLGVRWVAASGGEVPRDAVKGGVDQDGSPLYIGRGWMEGDLVPGKLQPSHGCTYVPWGCGEHRLENYEVLVQPTLATRNGLNSIRQPQLPYIAPISRGQMVPGLSITISAANHGEERFEVNFLCRDGEERALHFNARPDEECIVRNSLFDGDWGDEERNGGIPFGPGEPFTATFTIQRDGFYMRVAGYRRANYFYPHRCPIHEIDGLEITGDTLVVDSIDINSARFVPLVDDYSRMFNQYPPCAVSVPGRSLAVGTVVAVRGKPHDDVDRFEINFRNGNDIALHFNPRFDDDCVVRNSCSGGDWYDEERHGGLVFGREWPFEIEFTVHENHFEIEVNGRHLCNFDHRLPVNAIEEIFIDGELDVYAVEFQQPIPTAGAPLYYPPLPVEQYIPGGLYPGRLIVLEGIPQQGRHRRRSSSSSSSSSSSDESESGGTRFVSTESSSVLRQCASVFLSDGGVVFESFNLNLWSGDDRPFHLDARFDYGSDDNELVRNSEVDGGWGDEERDVPYFPFRINTPFQLMVKCDYDKFMVAVNGSHLLEYSCRVFPVNRIDRLTIEGDVQVNMLQIH